MKTSSHYKRDRKGREQRIKMIGEGKTVKVTIGERDNRPIKYIISDTGIITIWSIENKRVITKIIATPKQIRTYWEDAPENLIEIASYHKKMKWNH